MLIEILRMLYYLADGSKLNDMAILWKDDNSSVTVGKNIKPQPFRLEGYGYGYCVVETPLDSKHNNIIIKLPYWRSHVYNVTNVNAFIYYLSDVYITFLFLLFVVIIVVCYLSLHKIDFKINFYKQNLK